MKKRLHSILHVTLILLITCATAIAAEPVQEWTKLFDRDEIWLGADGIFSIPLDGRDELSSATEKTRTLFVFSDTMVGTADPQTKEYKNANMVNHSVAILEGNTPDPERIRFIYGKGGDMSRTNLFGYNCWLQDGIVIDGTVHLSAIRTGKNWKPLGLDLISVPLRDGRPQWDRFERKADFPALISNERFQSCFGAGILDHVSRDGYIYIYGYRDRLRGGRKGLIVARVEPKDFTDANRWRFWNGKQWTENLSASLEDEAVLVDGVSTELSVTPIEKDRYLLVYTRATMSPEIYCNLGDSPTGPFGKAEKIYHCPEPETLGKGIYTYNAKAHPHLSRKGTLLISYNVNRLGSLPHKTYEYRPRFVELSLEVIEK